ncbi:aldolase catalytic domain-containing protein [Sphingobacterium paludis]|uniref:4-hydroxy 2-oxovalerate aldolase n=1 Tax=Sphingobacterium paludis TaxID=1476465 RepID=A0A4R7CYN8_9SPHI|nr:aldolase catalytic domain-containing protein [Sphingobacterium paludis]TDS13723.1 4-hydroxy 2-oxovalerate aldolase [Sphingobacterium paludis]
MIKILDCTLRDGGYYTNWDFSKEVVDNYIKHTNNLPIDYLEVGYRSKPIDGYLGKYFYMPVYELAHIKSNTQKKLVIILNEKDVRVEDLEELLKPIQGIVSMVRIALDPQQLLRAVRLAEAIKTYGFEVGFNVMYMSKWKQYDDFLNNLVHVNGVADYFYMVDSYGGVFPADVKETIALVRAKVDVKLGFHGHNNLELALINSLTAMEEGVEIIDSTILGMGRGAGNLKTELFLTALNSQHGLDLNFNALGDVVDAFSALHEKYNWGTNLPYMISGGNSLPQKDVMDWVTTRFYSFNSIIQALQNQKEKVKDNEQLPVFKPQRPTKRVVVIGGGKGAYEHVDAVKEFIRNDKDVTIVHASSKNALAYQDLENEQIFCLVGNEGHRMEKVFDDLGNFGGQTILPPFPRKMGTYVPSCVKDNSFELESVTFTDKYQDSHTALALQITHDLGAEEIYLVGYDGYNDFPIAEKERQLTAENEFLFNRFLEYSNKQVQAITPTRYDIPMNSVYSMIYDK